jgi:hypothetical protein
MAGVLGRIVTGRPEPPSKHRPDLDPRLEAVCLKVLSKEVADRYSSMRQFAGALADCLRAAPQPAGTGTAHGAPVPVPWFGRKPLWLGLAGGVVGAATVLAGAVLWILTASGTVRVELNDPRAAVEVQVDGQRVERAGLDEPLWLRAGTHHLLVTGSTVESVSESFSLARGDNRVLTVKLVRRMDTTAGPTSAAPPADPGRGATGQDRRRDDDRDDDAREREHHSKKSGTKHDDDDDDR